MRLNIKVVSLSLALVFAIVFIICFIWDILIPRYAMIPAGTVWLPGYTGINFVGFIIGLVETFLYGLGLGALYVWIHNWLSKKFK